jgi:hypothetical protein
VTYDFHEHQIPRPLAQLKEKVIDNIKVDDFLWTWVEIVCSSLAENIQSHQAVNKYQQLYASPILISHIQQELKQS